MLKTKKPETKTSLVPDPLRSLRYLTWGLDWLRSNSSRIVRLWSMIAVFLMLYKYWSMRTANMCKNRRSCSVCTSEVLQ